MKKYKIKCPVCSKIDILNNIDSYQCSFCKHDNDVSECEIINIKDENRDENYIKKCLQKSIIASDEKKTEYFYNLLGLKNKSDSLFQYLSFKSEREKVDFLLNSNILNDDLLFIIKYILIKDKKVSKDNKEIIINSLKEEKNISLFKKYLENSEDDDKDLYNSLINEKIEVIEYRSLNNDKYLGAFFIISSLILSILITLICKFTVYEDCVYATTIVLGIIPSVLLYLGLNRLIKIKKITFKIVIVVIIFYFLTYIMTINYRDCTFVNSFYEHLKHIINAIPDILESITKHADIEWKNGE